MQVMFNNKCCYERTCR